MSNQLISTGKAPLQQVKGLQDCCHQVLELPVESELSLEETSRNNDGTQRIQLIQMYPHIYGQL